MKTEKLIRLFNQLFQDYDTILVHASGDPLYLPAGEGRLKNEIHFAHGFFSSALHEIAHWCIAGAERRGLVDYGYWYRPDGRTLEQQKEFESFESNNQALEWIFSTAAAHDFHVSADNLSGEGHGGRAFARQVRDRALKVLDKGLSPRALRLTEALIREFGDRHRFDAYWRTVRAEGLLPPH